jgi:hypothetical protein
LLLQACEQCFALCDSQSHASRREFFRAFDHPNLVFDGAAWDRLKYQLDCPFHPKMLIQPAHNFVHSPVDLARPLIEVFSREMNVVGKEPRQAYVNACLNENNERHST